MIITLRVRDNLVINDLFTYLHLVVTMAECHHIVTLVKIVVNYLVDDFADRYVWPNVKPRRQRDWLVEYI